MYSICNIIFSLLGDRTHTSRVSDNVNCEKPHLQLGGPSKQMQHILPELSPVRQLQQLPGAVNLQEVPLYTTAQQQLYTHFVLLLLLTFLEILKQSFS